MMFFSDFWAQKLIFTSIGEFSEFFPKYKNIYFLCLTMSVIFSWFEEYCFFLLTYFWNFHLPMFFWDSHLPTSFLGRIQELKKNEGKNYLRVQYVQVLVFLKKSFQNFHLPTSIWDFCLPTFITELPYIFLKNMRKIIVP